MAQCVADSMKPTRRRPVSPADGTLCSSLRALGGRKREPRLGKKCATGRRELHTASDTIEEQRANFALEVANLPAERWLRDVEALRRSPEMELLRDRDEIAKVPELHD